MDEYNRCSECGVSEEAEGLARLDPEPDDEDQEVMFLCGECNAILLREFRAEFGDLFNASVKQAAQGLER